MHCVCPTLSPPVVLDVDPRLGPTYSTIFERTSPPFRPRPWHHVSWLALQLVLAGLLLPQAVSWGPYRHVTCRPNAFHLPAIWPRARLLKEPWSHVLYSLVLLPGKLA